MQDKIKFRILKLAAAILLLQGAPLLKAQTEDADSNVVNEEEELVVTGFRSSVLNSIDAKRVADQVVDVVDSGDLGSLPDISIADALGRVPGVTTVRASGQSSQLNIRGMDGDFVQTSLNGREQASTSGYAAGSRWIAFDQYPSELITQAAVYKTPKASLIEGGVAGTVELKTANPLEAKDTHSFKANVRASYNDAAENVYAEEYGKRLSFSYQGKFLEESLGVAVGYAHLNQPNNAEEAIAYKYTLSRDVNNDGVEENLTDGFQLRAATGTDTRDGFLATLVYEPTSQLSFQFDYFKSSFESEDEKYGYTMEGLHRNADLYSLTDPSVENGIVTGASVTLTGIIGPWIEMRSEDQSTQSDAESFGLKTDWQITDNFNVILDVAHSSGEKTRLDRIATMHAYEFGTGTLTGGEEVATWRELSGQNFTYQNNIDNPPTVTFNTDYTDLSHMRLSEWEQFPHKYTDEIDSLKVDMKYELGGWVSSVEMGLRWSDRTFSDDRSTFRYGRREGQSQLVVDGELATENCEFNTSGVPCEPHALNGFVTERSFAGSFSGYPNYLVLDMADIANEVFGDPSVYEAQKTWNHNWTIVESGQVLEKVLAYYFMVNLATELGGIPVTGNLGVRVVETDTKSVGVQQVREGEGDLITDDAGVTRNDYKRIKYGPEYTDVLPSLNLNFEISNNDQVRFALAKVMGRPPVQQLRGGAGSWIDTAQDGVSPRYNIWSKGNPFLDPFRADQLDLSYEHYFDDGGAFTLALFYKDIESLIENIAYDEGDIDWDELGLSAPEGLVEGRYETTRNNDMGGYIRGVELAYTRTFDRLPGALSGLGLTASYSYTESETSVDGGANFDDLTLPLPGLSENIWSTTVFWDIGNFSTNLNMRYRDEFVYSGATPGGTAYQMAQPYTVMDLQLSYAFNNGFDLYFQVNNLTNEPSITTYGPSQAIGEYKEFGRQFFFGVGYSF